MTGCLNGGSCLFDEGKDTSACSCSWQWSGEKCEIRARKSKLFLFLSQSTIGRVFYRFYDNVKFNLQVWRGIDKITVSFPSFKICKMDCLFRRIKL